MKYFMLTLGLVGLLSSNVFADSTTKSQCNCKCNKHSHTQTSDKKTTDANDQNQ